MSVMISGRYLGGKRCALRHVPSGAEFHTAAPVDNQGDGSSFSPTDLVAGALGSCMLTVMAIVAERDHFPLAGSHFTVTKHMATNPRRVGRLDVALHLPEALTSEQRAVLERAAATCPVHKSLAHETEVVVRYQYDVRAA